MKKTSIFIATLLLLTVKLSAQAYSNSEVQPNLTDSNVFLDASSNFNSSANGSHSLGKGLVFPDTDLTQFEFDMTLADGIYFPSYFDGMVVYNVGSGNTMTGGDNPTAPSAVTPGFYYFSNPNGTTNGNVADGVWLPLGSGGSSQVQIGTTESITNLVLAGEPVYAIKGTFTADGTTTSATLANPAGMTSLYRITIYKDGAVYGTGVYSYDKSNGQAYTGNPGVSVVYPAGEYEYTMEYLK